MRNLTAQNSERRKDDYSKFDKQNLQAIALAFEKEISHSQYGRHEKGEDLRFSSLIKAFGMTPKRIFQ